MMSDFQGLSSIVATNRLQEEGFNEIPSRNKRSFFLIAVSVFKEPMFFLLLVSASVYFLIGDFWESLILCAFALLSISIAITQEWRSERLLESLCDLTSPRALVKRDGVAQRIAGREVVRGDLMFLSEGDRVPADGLILNSEPLFVDESFLTGESVYSLKSSTLENFDSRHVFAGTLIVNGSSQAVVTHTGSMSRIGRIGLSLSSIDTEYPRLYLQIYSVVKIFAFLSIVLSIVCIFLYGYFRNNWQEGMLSGLALGMAMLPEEFPLVLTVFMVMGAWRISKIGVLTRKTSSIETLGSATVLCTDKTGTLTQNKMTLVMIDDLKSVWKMGGNTFSAEVRKLLHAGIKASRRDSYDPMDLAFFHSDRDFAKNFINKPLASYSLTSKLMMMAQVYHEDGLYNVYSKGAPEVVAKACRFSENEMGILHQRVQIMAQQGMRVLAVAYAQSQNTIFPECANDFDYTFLGLVGFIDPLRNDVVDAVERCKAAGIRIVMITGDYPATAQAIARMAGLGSEVIYTGDQVFSLDDRALQEIVCSTHIFARVSPDQKLRIVEALKLQGEIVAMTGDGVNDAPSLRAAHIGVAMGGRGTDVAREASSIVLLDDSFSSLVETIALGRRIYDNLRKAMVYITAVHIPIAGLALLPLLFNKPLLLTPLLIALIEMVIDPACSIVLEAEMEEDDVMKRRPRNVNSRLLSPTALLWGITQGICAFFMVLIVWLFSYKVVLPEDEVRSLIFVSLMIANLALILINRSFSPSLLIAFERKNSFLFFGVLFVSLIFIILFFYKPASFLFHLGPIHGYDVILACSLGLLLMVVLEILKPYFMREKR